jgi:hypothetical protein
MKWRWRLINREDLGLWKEVLAAKYGSHILHNVVWANRPNPNYVSNWWKDICDLYHCVESKNWVAESFSQCLGDGACTSFWRDLWLGDLPLCIKFPRLFSLSTHKEATIKDLVRFEGDCRSWNFDWRRNLFLWEEEKVAQLVLALEDARLSNLVDSWRWKLDPEGIFSVKVAFESLSLEIAPGPILPSFEARVFNNIWASPAPSKVIVFSWQLLYNRIPTKDNLVLRGVLPPGSGANCNWCIGVGESASHLFLHCRSVLVVWY